MHTRGNEKSIVGSHEVDSHAVESHGAYASVPCTDEVATCVRLASSCTCRHVIRHVPAHGVVRRVGELGVGERGGREGSSRV